MLGFLILAGASCSPTLPKDEVKGTFDEAQKLYDQGKPEEAEKILTFLKIKKPSDAKTHFLLGRIYRESKRPDQAIEELEGV
ncbi:MAG TPA: tetratricopeptide repeat protein, partial [bacterium]